MYEQEEKARTDKNLENVDEQERQEQLHLEELRRKEEEKLLMSSVM